MKKLLHVTYSGHKIYCNGRSHITEYKEADVCSWPCTCQQSLESKKIEFACDPYEGSSLANGTSNYRGD